MKIVKKEPSGKNFLGMFIGAAIIDHFPLEGFMHQRIPLVTQKGKPEIIITPDNPLAFKLSMIIATAIAAMFLGGAILEGIGIEILVKEKPDTE